MSSIYDWSQTAADNGTADTAINWQEGQPPNTVNNSARQMMARQKEFVDDTGAVTAGGTANAITITLSSAVTSYFDGLRFSFKAASTNTASATINVNAIGAKTAVLFGTSGELALPAGSFRAGAIYDAIYLSALNSGSGGWLVKNPTVGPLYATKGGAYTAVANDNNGYIRFTAAATLSLTAAATLGANWHLRVQAYGGDVTIDPNSSETINGAATLLIRTGMSAYIICDGSAFFAILSGTDPIAVWRSKAVGEIYMADTSITGTDTPPASDPEVVFVRLTSGLTGAGAYNEGKLTSESVSGSAPLVIATAVVSVSGSPINGQTINLLNTEGRILRPSTSTGTKQNDAIQNITGSFDMQHSSAANANGSFTVGGISGSRNGSANDTTARVTFDASNVVRTSTETRMKNVGVMAFMRVK